MLKMVQLRLKQFFFNCANTFITAFNICTDNRKKFTLCFTSNLNNWTLDYLAHGRNLHKNCMMYWNTNLVRNSIVYLESKIWSPWTFAIDCIRIYFTCHFFLIDVYIHLAVILWDLHNVVNSIKDIIAFFLASKYLFHTTLTICYQ